MNILRTLIFLVLTALSNAKASLFTCDDINSIPKPTDERLDTVTMAFKTKSADMANNYKDPKFHDGKKPFLIYFAIDSAEPFMQYSVGFELAKLIAACKSSSNVNFVGLVNSLYAERNEIIVCKNKNLSHINLASYPELNTSLKEKRKYISEGDHTSSETGPLNYLVRYYPHTNRAFGRFPLAHPDFMHDLIKLVITEKDLFPGNGYMPFLHLKSHGSSETLLSGLHDCQTQSKVLAQEKVISSKLGNKDRKLLQNLSSPAAVAKNVETYEKILNKLYLGNSAGVGSYSNLGERNLGERNLGNGNSLGNIVTGLGAGEGLGAEFAFGLHHVNANAVLRDLFGDDKGGSIGFIMFEACDTNRDPSFHHQYIGNILGFYSASHSLWYRNLNWWALLEKANNSTLNLLELLKEKTAEIQNIEVIKQGQ